MTVSGPGPYIGHHRSLQKLYLFRGKGNRVTMDVYDFAHKYLFSYRVAKPFFRSITEKNLFSNKDQSFARVIAAYLARSWKPTAKKCVLKPPFPTAQAPQISPDRTLEVKKRKVDSEYHRFFSGTRLSVSSDGLLVVAHGKWLTLFDLNNKLKFVREVKLYSTMESDIKSLAFVNNILAVAVETGRQVIRICDPAKKFKVIHKIKIDFEGFGGVKSIIERFETRNYRSISLLTSSHDGLLAGVRSGIVGLWEAGNKFSFIAEKKVADDPIKGLAFLKDGMLACLLNNGDVHILDPKKKLFTVRILLSVPLNRLGYDDEGWGENYGSLNIDQNGLLISPSRVWDPKRNFDSICHRRGVNIEEEKESFVLSNGLVVEYHSQRVDVLDPQQNYALLCTLTGLRASPFLQVLPDGRLIGCSVKDPVRIWTLPPSPKKKPSAFESYKRGRSFLKRKFSKSAMACFQDAIRRDPLLIAAYEELVKLSPNADLKAHLYLKAAAHLGRIKTTDRQSQESKDDHYNRMKGLYEKACKANPKAPFVTHMPFLQFLEMQGRSKEFESLVKSLEKKYQHSKSELYSAHLIPRPNEIKEITPPKEEKSKKTKKESSEDSLSQEAKPDPLPATPVLNPQPGKKWKLKEACLALMQNNIQLLDLSKVKLGARSLSESLSKNTSLRELSLMKTGIGAAQLKKLQDPLTKHKNLTSLNLARNTINHSAMKILVGIIKGNKNLRILNLAANKIGKKSMLAFCDIPHEQFRLTTLSLANNPLGDNHSMFGVFSRSFLPSQTLTHVDFTAMNQRKTESNAADPFHKLIDECPSIKYLNLTANHIEAVGFEEIANSLDKNSTLSTLILSHNPLLCVVRTELVEWRDDNGDTHYSTVWNYPRSQMGIEALRNALRSKGVVLSELRLDHLKKHRLSLLEIVDINGIAQSPTLTTFSLLGAKLPKRTLATIQQKLNKRKAPSQRKKRSSNKKLSNKKE